MNSTVEISYWITEDVVDVDAPRRWGQLHIQVNWPYHFEEQLKQLWKSHFVHEILA